MRTNRMWTIIPLAALAAGCAGDGTMEDTELTDLETPGAEETMPAAAPPPAPSAAAMPASAQLEPVGDSGVAGEATVTGRGEQTEVQVSLTGGAENGTHPGHIHSGSCESIGGVVAPLQSISTDPSGAGTMTATVDLPAGTAMDGQHVIVYHGAGGAPVTCAEIPAST